MVEELINKYNSVAFFCKSTNEFYECVDFITCDILKSDIIPEKTIKNNRQYISENHTLENKCYLILTNNYEYSNNNYYFNHRNFSDIENYSDWSDFKIIDFSKISRKNKINKLNNET